MKKFLSTFLIAAISFYAHAQSPQGINYQAVAYDNLSLPVINHAVGVRLSVLDGGANGPVLYEETQTPNTDNTGLFSIVIGNGTVVSGTFAGINWGNGSKWLKTEIDITGGNNYVVMGSSQFLSTPYSFYADKAGYTSSSLSIPDGIESASPVIIPGFTNYVVPAGKNLYLSGAGFMGIIVNGDTLKTFSFSTGVDYCRSSIGISANSSVFALDSTRVGFLVDKKVEWLTVNIANGSFTVPPNKKFILVNQAVYVTGDLPTSCRLKLNGVSTGPFFLQLQNLVLNAGDVLSVSGCPGAAVLNIIINGYLRDK